MSQSGSKKLIVLKSGHKHSRQTQERVDASRHNQLRPSRDQCLIKSNVEKTQNETKNQKKIQSTKKCKNAKKEE